MLMATTERDELRRLAESMPQLRRELRERAERATPGPWRQVSVTDRNDRWTVEANRVSLFVGGRVRDEDDARFITAANPTVILALLDELDRRSPSKESPDASG